MKRWKFIIILLGVLTFVLLVRFPYDLDASSTITANSPDEVVKKYKEELHVQRETCYNDILLLGTLSNSQLQTMEMELENYLNELGILRNEIIENDIHHQNLTNSIELDILMINRTLMAIETQDESYLTDLSDMYHNLLQFQRSL
ncbi:hypothetical protein SSIL_1709 [Solibacillus silvestris StLB046]|uniref:Uncharacterized protein n=1 Tax=Solibacillus silvestris (strain StLB046) TaxID=1002809 RepID=F2F937_SOLSS|nr:hypothetical protein [Solibacillus silvestris]BAK16132.1 hypothetical protein SSIL_1709 [Solibacillus silvestris StLB046]